MLLCISKLYIAKTSLNRRLHSLDKQLSTVSTVKTAQESLLESRKIETLSVKKRFKISSSFTKIFWNWKYHMSWKSLINNQPNEVGDLRLLAG